MNFQIVFKNESTLTVIAGMFYYSQMFCGNVSCQISNFCKITAAQVTLIPYTNLLYFYMLYQHLSYNKFFASYHTVKSILFLFFVIIHLVALEVSLSSC